MGSAFGNLTRPGVESQDGQRQYFDTDAERNLAFGDASRQALQPSAATVSGEIPLVGETANQQSGFQDQSAAMPKMVKPSFQEVAGPGKQISAAETKGGKLIHLLLAGLQGGIAGRRASEQTVAASGGRRSGGFGTGAMAAIEEPIRQESIKVNLEDQKLQNQQRKIMLPWLAGNQSRQARLVESQISENDAQAAKYKQSPTDTKLESYVNDQGQQVIVFQKADGSTYEKVLGKVAQKEQTDRNTNEWEVRAAAARGEQWAKDLLKQREQEDIRARRASNEGGGRGGKEPRITPYQSAQIEDEKATELAKAEETYRDPKYVKPTMIDKKTNTEVDNPNYISDEDRLAELERKKAEIQRKYESKIVAGGGSIATKGTLKKETETKAAPPKKGEKRRRKGGGEYEFDGKQWVLIGGSS
jgi:hypothetical protein